MPKISALPPMTTPSDDDEVPVVDDSAATTKKFTLTLLKTYLQALVGWISTAMLADASSTAVKRSQVVKSGTFAAATLGTTGNKVVTGVGFTPKLVIFTMIVPSYSSISALQANGMMDATNQYFTSIAASTTATKRVGSATKCLGWINVGSTSVDMEAQRVSLDADGFTINVTTASTSAFGWSWVAIA